MKMKGIIGALIGTVFMSLFFAPHLFAGQTGKLEIWYMQPMASHQRHLEAVINEYKKANPGAEINLQTLGFGDFFRKVTASKAAGHPPDIVYTITSQMWALQQKGWLDPVDDVIDKLGGDQYFLPLPNYTKLDGHYWGVPISACVMHMEYRKDLFDKKGLKEPRTWEQILKAARALTEDLDGDGTIDRYGISMPLKREYVTGVHFLGFLWGNGGHVLDRNGKVVFNSPETIETLNFLKELYKYAPPGVTSYGWMQLATTYTMGKVAMTTFSALKPLADAIRSNETVANNTAITGMPTRLADQKPKGRLGTMNWLLFKECKSPELGKDFLNFWYAPERMTRWYHAEPVFLVPGEIPVIESEEYWNNDLIKKYRPALEKMIELNATGVDVAMEHPGILQPNTSIINQRLIIAECLQEVVLGELSAEKAAAKAQKKMEALIAKQK